MKDTDTTVEKTFYLSFGVDEQWYVIQKMLKDGWVFNYMHNDISELNISKL
jgi:hypothetical protein